MSNASQVAWGILGTGAIAHTFAHGLARSRTGRLVAVGSRTQTSADKFAGEFPPVRGHGSYEALLADPAVQAVYISTPHPTHAEWCIKAARAGKHILCEKPLTLNHAEAMAVVEAAGEHRVFLMEAFMYRCHPVMTRLVELIRSGVIGQVGVIQATFSFHGGYNPEGRLYKNELGGGGILDVGCYTISISRLVAGAAQGLPFANPTRITGCAQLDSVTGTDLYAVATAQFPGGILAQHATGVGLNQEEGLRVFGSKGWLHLRTPYLIAKEGGSTTISLHNDESKLQEIVIETPDHLYGLEADAVGAALAQGHLEGPCVTLADTLGNMAALDAWRESAGLVYESEKSSFDFPTVTREPLRRRPDVQMPFGTIKGLELPVSRLVLGCDNQQSMPQATAIFDDYFERGGNTFDTGWIYGPKYEHFLGRWMTTRGIRSQMAVIVKGAHTPYCTPDFLDQHLRESLDRLETDYADIYLMHRDNLKIPVAEFVDVLNQHHRAGRIKTFGGSNWTLARLQEAEAYAEKKGLQKFSCVSNNFSLARMVDPVWTDCISATDPAFKKWMTESGTALLPWSSQARGFFTDRAHPAKKDDPELVRCWYSNDNFQRRERAIELARKKSVQPINIALAYVLAQPFEVFALIGPRTISETASTFRGLSVSLTPEEVAWLNLE